MPELLTFDVFQETEKFLLYGHPKTGKTHCALTLPEPIYFIAVGAPNEAKTYFSKKFREAHGKKVIFIDTAYEPRGKKGQFETAVGSDQVSILLDEALELDDKGELEFASIIIDNATVLSEFQMNKTIEISSAMKDNPDTSTTLKKFRESGILSPADHDWGGAQSLMTKFVSWLFTVDKNVVLVAHEHETTISNRASQNSDLIAVKPQFIGKQRNDIANLFDNVWRFSREGPSYYARTEPQSNPFTVIAGTRVGGIANADYKDPNLSKTIAKFQKYAKEVA